MSIEGGDSIRNLFSDQLKDEEQRYVNLVSLKKSEKVAIINKKNDQIIKRMRISL